MASKKRHSSSSDKSKSKVWGSVTSTLWNVFKQHCDEEQHLHFSKLRSACNALNLFPSTSQVHEMLMCAVEYGSPCKPDHITFGEFCVLVSELRSYYYLNPKPPVPHSLCRTRIEQSLSKHKRRVFLGGSCNPTQWRAEIAIPYFKENGITFYNPQVQHWKPELMELEAQAKQMADFLFFVIDSKTRAISSMIEVAYLIATQRQVVVTMCDYKEPVELNGQVLSQNEMSEIIKGRLILTDLIERNSVPIFSDIQKALSCTKLSLAEDKRVQDLTLKDGAKPVKHGHLKLGRALLELREAFNSVDSANLGYLTKQDVCLAYKSCTGDEMDIRWLEHKRKSENEFLYEEFCAIVTEHRAQSQAPSLFQKLIDHVLHPFHWMISKFSPPPPPETDFGTGDIHDVYLGGSNGDLHWRTDIVIPMLRKHGLSFVNPAIHDWEQKSIPIHVALRENCHLLFYVITGDRRSLGSMCEAGYYIGKGCRMVLCIHKIPKEANFEGEQLTEQCIKDYNRGRIYLRDLASTEGVPLFEDITEATECVITMLNGQPTYLPSSSNLLG